MSLDQSIEYTYQLPIDIRILIALSDPQTASLMYVYDHEFRKYATEPAFVQSFEQFVSIKHDGNRVIKKLNNRELHISTGLFAYQSWYLNDKLHCIDDPAVKTRNRKEYFLNGKLHREDGPAIINSNEKSYYINGKLHREDGPAVITSDGTQIYYLHNKLHREDGPAIIYTGGAMIYYIDDKRHREDGPAAIYSNGKKFWYLNGKLQIVENTLQHYDK